MKARNFVAIVLILMCASCRPSAGQSAAPTQTPQTIVPSVTASATVTETSTATATWTSTATYTPSPTFTATATFDPLKTPIGGSGKILFRCAICTGRYFQENEVNLYAAEIDGSNLTRITRDLLGHDYLEGISPDGRYMLVSSYVDPREWGSRHSQLGNLYVMGIDGSNPVLVTNHFTDDGHNDAIWIDDGTSRIAFVVSENEGDWTLQIARPDGTEAEAIIHMSTPRWPSDLSYWPGLGLFWWKVVPLNSPKYSGNAFYEQWLSKLDGSPIRRWRNNKDAIATSKGRAIWYEIKSQGAESQAIFSIGPVDKPDDAEAICAIDFNLLTEQIAVSPDKSKIIYGDCNAGQGCEFYLCSIDDGSLITLPHGPVGPATPSWSPDGRRIMFSGEMYEYRLEEVDGHAYLNNYDVYYHSILDLETMTYSEDFAKAFGADTIEHFSNFVWIPAQR